MRRLLVNSSKIKNNALKIKRKQKKLYPLVESKSLNIMGEKIRIPSDIIFDEEIVGEINSNPALKQIVSFAKEFFIPIWHNKNEKIDGINQILPWIVFGENPVIITRQKRENSHLTPEEFLSNFLEINEEKIDFGNIGMLSLSKEVRYFSDELVSSLLKSFYSGNWILGPEVKELEKATCEKIGAKYSVGVNSGTDALVIGLRAIALSRFNKEFFSKEEDEIIVPDLTFLATAEAVILSGATPVIANVDEKTYTISPESIEESITKKTRGIVVVHLYGLPADMDAILDIAKRHNLFVVEDCAQSFYSKFNGKYTGTIGDVGCFSFFPSKNLGGHGDGGVIATNDQKIYEYASILGKHGSKIRDYAEYIGMNSRLDTIQASLLLKKLDKIEFFTERRRKIAEIYNREINHPDIILPYEPPKRFHVYHQYTIRLKRKKADELRDFLSRNNIETRVYYPYPMHKVPSIARNSKVYDNLYTEEITKQILSLPIEPLHPDALIKHISRKITEFMR